MIKKGINTINIFILTWRWIHVSSGFLYTFFIIVSRFHSLTINDDNTTRKYGVIIIYYEHQQLADSIDFNADKYILWLIFELIQLEYNRTYRISCYSKLPYKMITLHLTLFKAQYTYIKNSDRRYKDIFKVKNRQQTPP